MLVFSAPISRFADIDWSTISSIFDFKAGAADADTLPVYTKDEQELFAQLGFNPYSIFEDVNLGGGKIEFPSFAVLGKEYSMGSLDASIELPLNGELECKVDFENKTIQVLLGYSQDESADIGPDEQSPTYWSESYKEVKNMYQNITGKKVDTTALWNKFSSLRGKVKELKCSMGISVSAKITGFVTFSYENNDLKFNEGGVILAVKSQVELKTPVVPVVYVGIRLTPKVGGKLQVQNSNNKFVVSGEINGSFTAGGFIRIGEKGLIDTYVEGGIEGAISATFKFPKATLQEALSLILSGKLYADTTVFGYHVESLSGEFPFGYDLDGDGVRDGVKIYPKNTRLRSTLQSTIRTDSSFDSAVLMERDYLTEMSISSNEFYLEDVYSKSEAILLTLSNGNIMIIWVGDDGTKDIENRTSLFYSIYDGTTWSDSEIICENGEFNSSPEAIVFEDKVYLVWQKTEDAIKVGETLVEALEKSELYYSVFDGTSFSEAEKIKTEENTVVEFGQRITADDNGVYITWVENTENDIFLVDGSNSINYVSVKDGIKSEPECIVEIEGMLNDYKGFCENNKWNIVYSYKEDCINNLVVVNEDAQIKLVESENHIGNIHFYNGVITYLNGVNIESINVDGSDSKTLISGILDSFKLIEDGNGEVSIITVGSDETEHSVYSSEYDNSTGCFGEFTEIYKSKKYIADYTATYQNGECIMALNTCDFDIEAEEMFSDYNLFVTPKKTYYDVSIMDYAWTNDTIVPGDTIEIGFVAENKGNRDIHSLNYTLTDLTDNSIVGSGTINETIAVGGDEVLYVDYTVPMDFSHRSIRLDISLDEEEYNANDNYSIAELGNTDITISDVIPSYENEQFIIRGVVKNQGWDNACGNTIKVYDSMIDQTLIYEGSIDDILACSSTEFEFVLPEEYAYAAEEDEFHSIYIVASTESDEDKIANNEYHFVYNDDFWYELIDESNNESGELNGYLKIMLQDIAKALSYKHPYVDIKEHEIPVTEAADVIATAKEYFRSVYSYDIDGTFSYDVVYDSHKNTIVRFKFNYGTGLDSSAPVNTIEAQVNVLNEIQTYTNGMSDFDKAIYIHDYLVLNGEYDIELSDIIENGSLTDELLSERYDKYALLVNGTGACDTYATAYEYLLDNCGVDCVTISSTAMNHAWNMVKLNGSWYHVDCTWDDPVKDRIGLSRYDFFLVNDSEMREKDHYSWWTSYTSTSTTYSAIPRDDSNRVAYGEGHWCYYEDGSLYYSDVCGGNSKLITNLSFDAVDIYGNYIYGVSGKSLYKISVSDPDAGAVLIYALQETPKSIYIDKNGILEYYTYTAKSFETVDVDNCLAVESITVTGDKNVSRNGEKIQLGVIAHTSDYDFNPAVDSIIWTSSDEAVATVSETGLVTPDIAGSAVITATLGNFSDDYTITVEKWKDSNEGIINSGLSWKLDIDSKTLNIIGSGAIADYSNASDAPWYEYRNYIENLNIADTVTRIGKNAFVGFSKTKELTVPVSVTEIAEGAFAGWSAVEKLVLPFVGSSRTAKNTYDAVLGYIFGRSNNGVMQYYVSDGSTMHGYNYAIPTGIKEIIITDAAHISFGAFYNCSALEYLEINDGVTEIGDKMLAECSSVIGLKVPFIGSTASAEATFDAVVGYFFGTTDSSGKIQYIQFEYYPDTGRLSYGGYYYNIPASFKKIEVTNDADIPTGAFTNIAFDEIILGSATNEIKDYAFYLSNTVDKLIVYNRSCVFNDRFGLNSFTGTVYGYTGSTAETFANNKINMDFVPLDESACSHRFGQWIVIRPATCTNIGREYRICETCPYTETRTVATIDHNFSSTWTVDVQATCTDTGSSSRHCLNCSAVTDVISTPVLDHEFSDTWTVDNAATCTVDGLKSRHCINCDAVTDETVIEAPGHRYGSWKTITAATCETRGLKKKTCSVCGYEASRNIAALGHNYSADWTVDVEATCFETGSQSRHCTRCTSTVDVIEIPVLEHEIEDGFCNNCGSDFRDPVEKCSCNCHKGGFAGFIFKFILFFQRLFGANKECDCGIEHY